MSYEVVVAASFKREAKRLKKRHKSLNADIDKLITRLEDDPTQGTPWEMIVIKFGWQLHRRVKVNAVVPV